MFLFERAETTITLTPKDNATEATYQTQFEIVGGLKFAEGFIARLGKKRVEGNLNTAKRLLEAK